MENLANVNLKNIAEWMISNGSTVYQKKPFALNIPLYVCKPNPQLTLTPNTDYKKSANSVKYLGVLIDEQLSFKCHNNSLKKIFRNIGVIEKLAYYLSSTYLITLYYSLVHVHLVYVMPVWHRLIHLI